jgi:YidC/Oxa1 family membrane protein insertase
MMAMHIILPPPQGKQNVDIDKPIDQENQNAPDNQPKQPPNDSPDTTKNDVDPSLPPQEKVVLTDVEPEWITLGSLDPKSEYRMLLTLTNQGAAVVRAELNTDRYRGVQDKTGYLGQIVADWSASDKAAAKLGGGVIVQVLGNGTPAKKYGLQIGDRIVKFTPARPPRNSKNNLIEPVEIKNFNDLRNGLNETHPNDKIKFDIVRNERTIEQEVFLDMPPMDVIRPESAPRGYSDYCKLGGLRGAVLDSDNNSSNPASDQLSFLTTLLQLDENKLELPTSIGSNNATIAGIFGRDLTLEKELPNLNLRKGTWRVAKKSENEVTFVNTIPEQNIELTKTYSLAKNDEKTNLQNLTGTGYHLKLTLAVRNLDNKEHKIAYQLDGPTGLPIEGGWYAQKTGPTWSRFGIRDIVVKFQNNYGQVIPNNQIALDKFSRPWVDEPLDYIGVDSLYFQCSIRPNKTDNSESWHIHSMPIRVGERNYTWQTLTDVSFRLWGRTKALASGESYQHEYIVFLGPKDTQLLAKYGLSQTVSYGWFWFVAQPLLWVLQSCNKIGLSYGIAIIFLTICVRLMIFPLSRKMAIGMSKMTALQPQIKAINEKYKDDVQKRSEAINALFKEHNYNPMSGCLPLFIQFPIFIGLYKALSIDPGLYGTPLITKSLGWCTDLSAPDRLIDWSEFWIWVGYSSFNEGQGFLTLGPFFNLLPMLTIVLFLLQQEIMMPPPTDDQAKMQRKMMRFMMIFMGLLFFRVPSGLCIYFIASTMFALLERKFIPKPATNEINNNNTETENKSEPDNSPRNPKARDKRRRNKEPERKENFILRWIRRVAEQAANEQRLDTSDKKKKKRR